MYCYHGYELNIMKEFIAVNVISLLSTIKCTYFCFISSLISAERSIVNKYTRAILF